MSDEIWYPVSTLSVIAKFDRRVHRDCDTRLQPRPVSSHMWRLCDTRVSWHRTRKIHDTLLLCRHKDVCCVKGQTDGVSAMPLWNNAQTATLLIFRAVEYPH